jgi:hypothetical protein
MALRGAQAAASSIFRLLLSQATVRSGSDRLGTIDLPWGFLGRAIVPNGLARRASGGVLGFRLLLAQATVRSGSDRLGAIDLPWRASGGVLGIFESKAETSAA